MISAEHIINLKGRQFVLYAGLLDEATKTGLMALTVRLLQVPAEANGLVAIAEATAIFGDGRSFVEIGDAGPGNCSAQMLPSAIRLAATRAKARALRDALNVGMCSMEELPPQEAEGPAPPSRTALPSCCTCERVLTVGQATLSERAYGRALCPACQKGAKAA